jgi:hypothetical protein
MSQGYLGGKVVLIARSAPPSEGRYGGTNDRGLSRLHLCSVLYFLYGGFTITRAH